MSAVPSGPALSSRVPSGRAAPLRFPAVVCDQWSPACVRSVTVQFQARPTWCVPAAARAIVGGAVDQGWLAAAMGTGLGGTLIRRVPSAIRQVTNRPYSYSGGRASFVDADDLLAKLRYSLGTRFAPVVVGVEGDLLPYWPASVRGLHVVVAVGWTGRSVIVWDPLDAPWNTQRGGFHVVAVEDLASASSLNGRAMVAMIP